MSHLPPIDHNMVVELAAGSQIAQDAIQRCASGESPEVAWRSAQALAAVNEDRWDTFAMKGLVQTLCRVAAGRRLQPAQVTGLAEVALGAVEAQLVVQGIRSGSLRPEQAWFEYVELQSRHGKSAPACRAFILELAKHVAVD